MRRSRKKKTPSSDPGLKHGFRSGLEEANAAHLDALGQPVHFEQWYVEYIQPEKRRKYTPDFVLPNGIVIETKGEFKTADRQKHLMIRECHPALDLRFIFSRPNQRISKQSKTTYAMWCDKNGFEWAATKVPIEWTREPVRSGSMQAAKTALNPRRT